MALSSPGAPSTPGCALQIRSDQTSCRKDEGPSPLQLSQNQAAWYASSWRSLQPGASTPGDSRLNTPETTPTSIPTNLLTAPSGVCKMRSFQENLSIFTDNTTNLLIQI